MKDEEVPPAVVAALGDFLRPQIPAALDEKEARRRLVGELEAWLTAWLQEEEALRPQETMEHERGTENAR